MFLRSDASSARAGSAASPSKSDNPMTIGRMEPPRSFVAAAGRPYDGVGRRSRASPCATERRNLPRRFAVSDRISPRARTIFRACLVVLVVILALPYLIAPFYRFVDPVSTLMLWRWATGARVERTWT